MSSLNLISEHRCFGGTQRFYSHESRECRTEMRFSVYLPPQASQRAVPVLYYLAGLTCTEETLTLLKHRGPRTTGCTATSRASCPS